MADPSRIRASLTAGPPLPVLERFVSPPAARFVVTQIESRTSPGDVVLELHGRGGWVSRSAIERLRRAFAIESTALSRLVAEVVLRPPDVRHYDAAFNAMAIDRRGDVGLRQRINSLFASRCASCAGSVVVDEFIWDAEADVPARKSYRCSHCRDRRNEGRPVPVDEDDIRASGALDAGAAHALLRARMPAPSPEHPLPDQLLGLFSPRALVSLAAILERIESDLRAPAIQACLRLALIHVFMPGSRLNGYPGRVVPLRIVAGKMREPGSRHWRERNIWQLFDEGVRAVRGFVQRLETGPGGDVSARVGADLGALLDGTANVALRFGMPLGPETFGPPPSPDARTWQPPRPRRGIRLAIAHPPVHWTPDLLGFAYLTTALAVGPGAASTLPLRAIYEAPPKTEWGWDAASLRRSLAAAGPVLAPDARVVLTLDPTGPEGLVAAVIGAVSAGFALQDALLTETSEGVTGHLELVLSEVHEEAGPNSEASPVRRAQAGLDMATVERAVTDIAVAVLRMRGEPARFERLLGEVLIGLDRLGHLGRLVGTGDLFPPPERPGAEPRAVGLFGELPGVPGEADERPSPAEVQGMSEAREPAPAPGGGPTDAGASHDPVRLTLQLVMGELRKPDHPRLAEVEPGRWWLRDRDDLQAVEPPLSERVERAVYGLLSTSDGISEASALERIGRLFRGPDAPDEELVRACLASYRSSDTGDGLLRSGDSLPSRLEQHGRVIGMLTEFAHRIGMRAWIARREQRRRYGGATVGALLSDVEQRVYLPLVIPGPADALEEVDCIWYVRGRAAFLFDVEWMAMLDEPIRRRGSLIPAADSIVRFLVIPPERVELVRLKLERSPLLRERMEEDNWHILRWDSVLRLHAGDQADLDALGPLLGLEPDIDRPGEQMGLFS